MNPKALALSPRWYVTIHDTLDADGDDGIACWRLTVEDVGGTLPQSNTSRDAMHFKAYIPSPRWYMRMHDTLDADGGWLCSWRSVSYLK
jgi:hypothetical protein